MPCPLYTEASTEMLAVLASSSPLETLEATAHPQYGLPVTFLSSVVSRSRFKASDDKRILGPSFNLDSKVFQRLKQGVHYLWL